MPALAWSGIPFPWYGEFCRAITSSKYTVTKFMRCYAGTGLERPHCVTKMRSLKTGGLWSIALNCMSFAKKLWSFKTGGLSWQ